MTAVLHSASYAKNRIRLINMQIKRLHPKGGSFVFHFFKKILTNFMYTCGYNMDLQKQFKDLDLGENLEMDVAKIEQKLNEENLPESREDFDEGEKMVKELEARLKQLAGNERRENVEEYEDLEQETFLEKMQPFILPICLTLFAIVFAGLFLYFFSKSRVETVQQAIINNGVPEQVNYPPQPVPVIVKEEPLVCTEPQILNDTGDACIDPEPVATTTVPVKVAFEDGTTTEAHVRFSFDK